MNMFWIPIVLLAYVIGSHLSQYVIAAANNNQPCVTMMTEDVVETCINLLTQKDNFEATTYLQECQDVASKLEAENVIVYTNIMRGTLLDRCKIVSGQNYDTQNVDTQLSQTCSQNCGTNGKCQSENDICICDSGYAGDLCQINLDTPPNLITVSNSEICDVADTTKDCTRPVITAEDMSVNHVLCRYQKAQFDTDGEMSLVGERAVSPPIKISGSETQVVCPVPDASPYVLELSQDATKTKYSTPIFYNAIDLTCWHCPNVSYCTPKVDSCLVKGVCYKAGEESKTDSCLICSRSASAIKFTTKSSCVESSAGLDTTSIIIAFVTVSALFLLVLLALWFVCRPRLSEKETRKQPEEMVFNNQSFQTDSPPIVPANCPPKLSHHPAVNGRRGSAPRSESRRLSPPTSPYPPPSPPQPEIDYPAGVRGAAGGATYRPPGSLWQLRESQPGQVLY